MGENCALTKCPWISWRQKRNLNSIKITFLLLSKTGIKMLSFSYSLRWSGDLIVRYLLLRSFFNWICCEFHTIPIIEVSKVSLNVNSLVYCFTCYFVWFEETKHSMPDLKLFFFRILLDWLTALRNLSIFSVVDLLDLCNFCNWLFHPKIYIYIFYYL